MDNLISAKHNESYSAGLYAKASKLYNNAFAEVVLLKQSHISAIDECLRDLQGENLNYGAKDEENLDLSGDFAEDLAFFIAHENENIAFYNALIDENCDESAKDMFYLFQAHSYNDILPALNSLNSLNLGLNSNTIFNEIEKTKEFFKESTQTLEKLKNKQLSHAELESFLKKLNFSLLGGAVLGAGLAFMFNEISNQYTKD